MNSFIYVTGNLTADPDLRWTTSGHPYTKLSLAVDRSYRRNNEWVRETDFVRGTAWGALAEHIAESCTKGMRMMWGCQLSTYEWDTREGDKRREVELRIRDCGPSLLWATADVLRAPKTGDSKDGPF